MSAQPHCLVLSLPYQPIVKVLSSLNKCYTYLRALGPSSPWSFGLQFCCFHWGHTQKCKVCLGTNPSQDPECRVKLVVRSPCSASSSRDPVHSCPMCSKSEPCQASLPCPRLDCKSIALCHLDLLLHSHCENLFTRKSCPYLIRRLPL